MANSHIICVEFLVAVPAGQRKLFMRLHVSSQVTRLLVGVITLTAFVRSAGSMMRKHWTGTIWLIPVTFSELV